LFIAQNSDDDDDDDDDDESSIINIFCVYGYSENLYFIEFRSNDEIHPK